MLFPAPSPRGTNSMGLYLDGDGCLRDRFGRSWSSQKLALDEQPDLSDLHAKADAREEAEERIKKVRGEIERYCQEADLDSRICADIFKILQRVIPVRDKTAYGPNATGRFKDRDSAGLGRRVDNRGAGATDEEDLLMDPQRFSKLATHLLGQGLAADDVEEALKRAGCPEGDCEQIVSDCVEAYGEADDRLPVSALHGGMGGYMSGMSKHGEHEMAHDDSFDEMFGTARLRSVRGDFGYGAGDKIREMEREVRRRPRSKRMAHDARDTVGGNDFYEMFPGAERLRVRGL
jgi:hypothetical protein